MSISMNKTHLILDFVRQFVVLNTKAVKELETTDFFKCSERKLTLFLCPSYEI